MRSKYQNMHKWWTCIQARELLRKSLVHPDQLITLDESAWDLLLPLTRHARLTGRLAERLIQLRLFNRLAEQVQDHLVAAMRLCDHRQRMILWEINRLERVLKNTGIDTVLLKGGAYIVAGLSAASGRLLADVDILVARKNLERVEKILVSHGWEAVQLDDYDEHYYRAWMHEIPPLRHRERYIEVDVHHTVLPISSRYKLDPELLLKDARSIAGCHLKMLAPCDMVLHSAAHLFLDGEFANGLRDLSDLDLLLREFSHEDCHFYRRLLHRAEELHLERPAFYALRYTSRLFETPIPQSVLTAADVHSPGKYVVRLMDALFERALMPNIPHCSDRWTRPARRVLYMRAHWLKMPPALLLYHLFRKSIKRRRQDPLSEATLE
jgi:hypothetical protein